MQNAVELRTWHAARVVPNANLFAVIIALCIIAAAAFASWLPLQVSIVTLFLFAGPHNWFELRYFLMRLPVRFGRSRNFFLTAFAGLGVLTLAYVSLPFIYNATLWTDEAWSIVIAAWNTLLLLWLGILVWLRSKQKLQANWTWTIPLALALASLNWLGPDLFSLAIVYVHPLIALWFLDRQLRRTRPAWLRAYRRCLSLLPLMLAGVIWQLSRSSSLSDDNGLFWRITQHSGAQLLPQVSSHLLVSVHMFLETLHYGVWIVVLPLIGPTASARFWKVKTVPVACHPKGFPRLIAGLLIVALVGVVVLWFGFSINYTTTRDVYFTIAIAHVLAEAPFLLRML
ncbi:MAG TPA: hypothetical protein VJ875_22850 [Pyrinomonadaceae bacterium]|nr:hypothetical protein [Pyrinomonadaceae bacterium]